MFEKDVEDMAGGQLCASDVLIEAVTECDHGQVVRLWSCTVQVSQG